MLGNGTPAAGYGQPGVAPCSDAFGAALLRVQTTPQSRIDELLPDAWSPPPSEA